MRWLPLLLSLSCFCLRKSNDSGEGILAGFGGSHLEGTGRRTGCRQPSFAQIRRRAAGTDLLQVPLAHERVQRIFRQWEAAFRKPGWASRHALHLPIHHHVRVVLLTIRAFLPRWRTHEHGMHRHKRSGVDGKAVGIFQTGYIPESDIGYPLRFGDATAPSA